ncbi:MAG TPA: hypothetical protein VM639_00825 [Dongiaceae bacterium]|nr:hypothetical protein [Dongiaceae bacterium]
MKRSLWWWVLLDRLAVSGPLGTGEAEPVVVAVIPRSSVAPRFSRLLEPEVAVAAAISATATVATEPQVAREQAQAAPQAATHRSVA